MLQRLVLLLLVALPAAPAWGQGRDDAGPDKPGPTPEQVARMVLRLEAALEAKEPKLDDQVQALREAIDVPHGDVVQALEPALKSKQPDLHRTALETLGRMRHEEALARLLLFHKKQRKRLAKDPELGVLVTKSLGRHGDAAILGPLTDRLFSAPPEVARARVLAIATVRDRAAVEALMDLMKGTDRRRIQNMMRHFHLALCVLTGRDEGLDQDRWRAWWRGVDKDWKVTPKQATLPEDLQRTWDGYWGNQRRYERNKGRNERGQDPEDDPGKRGGDDGDKGGRRKRRGEGDGAPLR